ncbi:hypothetical protein D9M71_557400 [compost metagenome]
MDDIQHADLRRRPRQAEAAAHAFGGRHQPGTGQLGEDLGQVFLRHALQLGQVAHAGITSFTALVD